MAWQRIPLESVLERMPVGVAIADAGGVVLYINKYMRRRLGMAGGAQAPRLMATLRAGSLAIEDAVIRHATAQRGAWHGETTFITRRGTRFSALEWVYALQTGAGAVVHIHFVQDLTVFKQLQTLSTLAFYDSLTGLPNRNLLIDRLQAAMARSVRSGRPFALLYLDIDGLKAVNDTAGHAAGDALLQRIARNLQQALRKRDTVARLGGDEFVVVLEEMDDPQASGRVAQKLLAACRCALPSDGTQVVTASIGIGCFPQHATDAETLLHKADEALYRAKAQGRDCYKYAEDGVAIYAADLRIHRICD